jgi:hypothetical protein
MHNRSNSLFSASLFLKEYIKLNKTACIKTHICQPHFSASFSAGKRLQIGRGCIKKCKKPTRHEIVNLGNGGAAAP